MKLEFAARSDAQNICDRLHDWMLANDINYAASVAAGQTTAWAVPYHETNEFGQVTNPLWCVAIKPRVIGALTDQEKAKLI